MIRDDHGDLVFKNEEIRARRRDPDVDEREDILSLLVQARHEDGEPMSDEELRDELMTLLVAGHETTATSLAWAVERLVRHPDEARAAARRGGRRRGRVPGRRGQGDPAAAPGAPVVVRAAHRADRDRRATCCPRASTVAPVHLPDPPPRRTSTPSPTRFRPERFLEQPAGTYTWIPFGGGVRRCLGASFALFEMKQVLPAIVAAASSCAPPARDARARRAGGPSP